MKLRYVFVAGLCMTLVWVSAARATEFTATAYPVEVSGSQPEGAGKHKVQIGSGTTECDVANFSAVLSAKGTALTINPHYTGCKAFGLNQTMTMNGCDYILRTAAGGLSGSTDIECPAGKQITLDTAGNLCNTHYGSQSGLGGITYEESGNHLLVSFNITSIHAVVTGTIFCPVTSSTTTYTNARYNGTVTLKGSGGATKIDAG